MALSTAGSSTTTVLRALHYIGPATAEADIAAFNALCKNDVNVTHPVIPNTMVLQGVLYVPNRSPLVLRPGDWVVVDPATGFPFALSAAAIGGANWVHS